MKPFSSETERSLFLELAKLFLSNGHHRVQIILDAIEAKDLEAAAREAHSLKSTSKTLGIDRLAEICEGIENSSDLSEARKQAGPLEAEYNLAEKALQKRIREG